MAAHRYWRVRVRPQEGNFLICQRLEFRTTKGGPTVATGGTDFASSALSSWVPANAFDSDPSTYWQSINAPQDWFIGYDFGLGNDKDIVEVAWTIMGFAVVAAPKEWWLEWSDDNVTWSWVAYDNFIPAWSGGQTRTMNTDIGGVDVIAANTSVHGAFDPKARVNSLTATIHATKNNQMNARVNGLWATVHASVATASNARVNGSWAVVHTSVKNNPIGVLPVRPNAPVVERLSWLTDVIQNYDGTDQRISIRLKPRRELSYNLSLLNDDDYRRAYDMYYNGAGMTVHAPAWGYQAYVKQAAQAGTTTIYCNTYRGDFRPNDTVLISLQSGEEYVYQIQDVYNDRIVIGRPLSADIPAGAYVVPCVRGRFTGGASFDMNAIDGASSITIRAEKPREQEVWPYKSVTLPTYDGYVLLDRRPTNSPAGHAFDKNVEVIDNETGIEKYVTAWRQTYVEGAREYMVNTLWAWDELQFWRTLFDYCRGRQKAFLTPTYRNDLEVVSLTENDITVKGRMYYLLYKDSNTYRRFQIETEAGTVNVKSASVVLDGNGDTVISFTSPIPSGISQSEVKRVSYLALVRLGGDSVTITHEETRALVGLSLRTATE